MNAMKALELGFVDGLLEDPKLNSAPEAYAFSENLVEHALINKITEKVKPEKQKPTGRPVDELKQKLYKALL